MNFNDLDARTARERINAVQVWEAWLEAEDLRRHSFLGTMAFEPRSGKDYLYRRIGASGKSLGPRNADTEQRLARFQEGRAQNAGRLSQLAEALNTQAAILRGLGAGRLPVTAARVLREIRLHGRQAGLRVVGTNALYAYEAMAGVSFDEGATATGDIDLLQDDRKRLKFLTEEKTITGLKALICTKVDPSFAARSPRDYRLTNNDGYMIELIRPEPRPAWRAMAGIEPLDADGMVGAPVMGLQWLVNAPAVEAVVIDERGFPAPMRCPDPRFWAAHKLWLSRRDDREPVKKGRDHAQAVAVVRLVRERLPHLPIDEAFLGVLPAALRKVFAAADSAPRGAPEW